MTALRLKVLFCLLPALLLCLSACASAPGPEEGGGASAPTAVPADSVTAAPESAAPTREPDAVQDEPAEASPAPTAEAADGETEEPAGTGMLTVNFGGELVTVPAAEEQFFLREEALPGFLLPVPREQVESEFVHNAWRFTFLPEAEEETAFLEISYVAGTDAASLLPAFMDSYLDFTDIEFSSAGGLGRSRRPTATVVASGSSLLMKGWLMDVEGGVVAAVQSCPLDQLTAQGSYFDAMLEQFLLLE